MFLKFCPNLKHSFQVHLSMIHHHHHSSPLAQLKIQQCKFINFLLINFKLMSLDKVERRGKLRLLLLDQLLVNIQSTLFPRMVFTWLLFMWSLWIILNQSPPLSTCHWRQEEDSSPSLTILSCHSTPSCAESMFSWVSSGSLLVLDIGERSSGNSVNAW